MNSARARSHRNIQPVVHNHATALSSSERRHGAARQCRELPAAQILLANLNPVHFAVNRPTNSLEQSRHFNLGARSSAKIRSKSHAIGDVTENPPLSAVRQWPQLAAGTSPRPGSHPPIQARKSPRAHTDSKGSESEKGSGSGNNSSPSSRTRAATPAAAPSPATRVAG